MKLERLKPARGATGSRRRVGRGPGSGTGSQSTRGHKGQKARKGYSGRAWFEGGQMPLQRRIPKRGFTNIHARPVSIVNVSDLEALGETEVTRELLADRGLVRDPRVHLKVLGKGDIRTAVTVKAHAFSASAREKIEAAGGKAEVIKVPARPKRYRKKEKSGA